LVTWNAKPLSTYCCRQENNLSLLLASIKNLHTENETLRSIIGELRDEKQQLEQRLIDLEAKIGAPQITRNYRQPMKIVEFVMKDFEKFRRERTAWYSLPFYSHTRGYKMCLQVNANGLGQGKGTLDASLGLSARDVRRI
jgi:hypothetical protein